MELTPLQSVSLSEDVYNLSKLSTIDAAITYLNSSYNGKISFYEENLLKGKTGGPGVIKVRTAFGFLLVGKGEYKNYAFILFRGTQYLADWLTNLNISLSRSASGQAVHDGFNKAFHSMLPQIQTFVSALPSGTEIHCLGHSLGGALATIAAEWVSKNTIHKPRLYTYGSPRVGLIGFSENCTSLLKEENIFRVYHRTDIVPCIPIWPFMHTPSSGREYFLPSPGLVPWSKYHDMRHYNDSVGKKSWSQIYAMRPPKRTDSGIETWLKSKSIIGPTISSIEWLNDAIIYVLKKCFEFAGRLIDLTASTYFTLMDRLAYILRKGIELSEKVSGWVLLLMQKIAQFLGMRKLIETADITREFMRQLLLKLSARVNEISKQALSRTLADGRAI
ncbi:lipase family protein [Microbulbifer marinus]|uniref:Lipase (Class 3) n=1 Tax=Microbulbifer marinus TaxID=658218 RepID=A0A1H3ZIS9_9GAMM|nr:lipase family protein [Microbulbifer marinus]SEA23633.1 Lipase (class 3) [Microbulbifer marinus]